MSRSSRRGSLRRHAPRSGMICKSSSLVRVGSGACLDFLFAILGRRIRNGRRSECISGSAFYNAFRGLKPRRQPIRPGVGPPQRNRRESFLFPFAFEAEPPVAVFAGDCHRAPERTSASVWGTPAIGLAGKSGAARRRPPVDLPSLGRGGRYQPHLPPLACRVEKGSITHRQLLRRYYAPRSVLTTSALHGGCQK
jgi:hypothetical protein